MSNKRSTAGLIPYRYTHGELSVYMQMRGSETEYYPNHLGFFGGSVEEGETIEEGVHREIQEELNFTLDQIEFFRSYELDTFTYHVFLLEVTEDFPSLVSVQEGAYGRFLHESFFESQADLIPKNNEILKELKIYLTEKVV